MGLQPLAYKKSFGFLQKNGGSNVKVCKCFPGQEVSPEGRCIEEKDLGILDLEKLFRKPFWSGECVAHRLAKWQ